MARAALKLPQTQALYAGSFGHLPIFCLDMLMGRRIFVRFSCDPGPWLLQQITLIHPHLEVHPALVNLVVATAVAAVEPLGTPRCGIQQPPRLDEQADFAKSQPLPLWPADRVLAAYTSGSQPARALLAMYVLTVNDVRRSRLARGGEPLFTVPRMQAPLSPGYGNSFVGQLQLDRLLHELRRVDFAGGSHEAPWILGLRAPLEALILAEQPHLRDARSALLKLSLDFTSLGGVDDVASERPVFSRALSTAANILQSEAPAPTAASVSVADTWNLRASLVALRAALQQVSVVDHQQADYSQFEGFWSKVGGY